MKEKVKWILNELYLKWDEVGLSPVEAKLMKALEAWLEDENTKSK